jgi:NADH-quinone oxidoreductase subunit N
VARIASANDLLVLAVASLLASIPLYALIGLARTPVAAAAALKTYLLGVLFSIVLLAGWPRYARSRATPPTPCAPIN